MTVFRFIAAKRGKRIGEEWENAFEKYFAWSTLPGVLLWEDATGDQINKATSAKSKAKFADLDQVCECVPLVDPELKTTVESRVRQKCGLSRDDARNALNELCVTGRIFTRGIPNSKPKARGFAGWCQAEESEGTNGSEDTAPPEQTAGPEESSREQPSREQPSSGQAASQGQAADPEPTAGPERPSPEATASPEPVQGPEIPPSP
jgi:hypothetical protein